MHFVNFYTFNVNADNSLISILFQAGEEVIHESEDNVTLERQTLYCVPVPGENEWVKQVSFLFIRNYF